MENTEELELKNVLKELNEAVVELKENVKKLEQMKEQSLVLKEKALQKLELYPEDSRKIAEGLMLADRSISNIDFMINDAEKYISYLTDKIAALNVNS